MTSGFLEQRNACSKRTLVMRASLDARKAYVLCASLASWLPTGRRRPAPPAREARDRETWHLVGLGNVDGPRAMRIGDEVAADTSVITK